MKNKKSFSIGDRVNGFKYAFNGIKEFFQSEHNAWIHLLATLTIIVLVFFVHVSPLEIIALVFAIGLVWMAELFNTAIEKIMDFISEEKLHKIKFIKDLAAAGVLIAAITALIIGGIVFIPKIL